MRINATSIRVRASVTVAALVAAAGATAGAVALAGAAPAAERSQAIRSGAGPGWPKVLHPSDFVRRVDNPYFPLEPGGRWRYRGRDADGPFADRMHVKDKTKTILGVRATVVHDVVLRHGKQREVTNDWYAQDKRGNVWYFGERTKELSPKGNVVTREGSWKSGRDGARPGILMPAHPKVGRTAREEFFKGHAEDRFKVLDVNARVKTPAVSSRHAVRTKEWTPLEKGVIDNKYYARGYGDVKEKTVKGGLEVLHLVEFHQG